MRFRKVWSENCSLLSLDLKESKPELTQEEVIMTSQSVPVCGEHRVSKEWRAATFEYGEDGVSIRVPNIYAWVARKMVKPPSRPKQSMN